MTEPNTLGFAVEYKPEDLKGAIAVFLRVNVDQLSEYTHKYIHLGHFDAPLVILPVGASHFLPRFLRQNDAGLK